MGISTKVAKRIVRNPSMTRPDVPGSHRRIAISNDEPDYVVVYVPGDPNLIVTVLFNQPADYIRNGVHYILSTASEPTAEPLSSQTQDPSWGRPRSSDPDRDRNGTPRRPA
jgi:hypothetical protein